ncbi:MAG: recombinase family protein [Herpetosiphonaceae bacterium]|nr:recombinase family protein [Herpetosiphonaceae bacterium]
MLGEKRGGIGQSLAVQLDKLQDCDPIFQEKRSGATDYRPQLATWLQYVRRGDILVVTKLNRLARSTLHLCQLAETLQRKGVALRVLDQAIDTSDATGLLLFNMLGAIAQFETEIRAERQLEGIANARARGVAFGRRPALTPEQVVELRERRQQGILIKTLMADYGLGKTALYRYLNRAAPPAADDDAGAMELTRSADAAILIRSRPGGSP